MAFNYSPKIVTNGLVLYFDAANPRSYISGSTVWNDMSRIGNNGALTNGPTYNRANAGSIVFDGTNDYVNTSLSTITRPFSMNVWVYFNSLSGWQTMLGQNASGTGALGAFYFQKTNPSQAIVGAGRTANTFGMALTQNVATSAATFCYDSMIVTASIWYNYHISATTTDLTLYRNGTSVFTTGSTFPVVSTSGSVIAGAGYYSNAIVDYGSVNLPIIQIYNRALSAQEVLQNYNALKGRFGL